MDKIFERYLNAIGYEQKYYQYFEKVCFKNTATVNACLIFKADLIVDTFIPFAPLEEFHSCVNAFKDQPKGFVSSLNFVYKKVPKKEEIKEIIDEFVEKNNYYELDNYRISTKDKTITFEYNSMIDVNQLKQKTEKLSNLLDFANCKYSMVFGFVSGVDVEDLSASFEEDYA
ncbi:MAG: hypothetical protein WCQ80_02510, partial [Bacilli bacterium]